MSFVDYEERKLNSVVANFSNNDKKRYMEEVDYIRSLLELLRKQKQEVKDAPTKEQRDKAKKEAQAAEQQRLAFEKAKEEEKARYEAE